jgi:amphiphysin
MHAITHAYRTPRLNIYYMLLEKLQSFGEGKYDITNVPGANIAADYEGKRTDAWERIEALGITSRMVSTGADDFAIGTDAFYSTIGTQLKW